MMQINERELNTTVLQLISQIKNPYLQNPVIEPTVLKITTGLPDSQLEFEQSSKKHLLVNCVHTLIETFDAQETAEVREEANQFNQLMEKVMLPVVMWENKKTNQFQLRWQERFALDKNPSQLWQTFSQSLSLALAVRSKLERLLSNNRPKPTLH
jgi:hypothetical protein